MKNNQKEKKKRAEGKAHVEQLLSKCKSGVQNLSTAKKKSCT
jgi:hypothetical protein